MSIFYHPYLFDADRFERSPDDELSDRVAECLAEAVPDSAVADEDIISTRVTTEPYRNLGGLFDAIAYHLANERPPGHDEASGLLRHVGRDEGRWVEATDGIFTGYLSAAECGRLRALLRSVTFDDPAAEAERELAGSVLAYAVARRRGLAISVG